MAPPRRLRIVTSQGIRGLLGPTVTIRPLLNHHFEDRKLVIV